MALLVCVASLSSCDSGLEDPLEGCWELQSWEALSESGKMVYPYGRDARGELCYADGRVHLTLAHFDRELLGTKDRSQVADSSLAHAARTYFNYSGSYEYTDTTVAHHVELCNVPDWQETSPLRHYSIKENQLILLSPAVNGMTHTLKWRKK